MKLRHSINTCCIVVLFCGSETHFLRVWIRPGLVPVHGVATSIDTHGDILLLIGWLESIIISEYIDHDLEVS